MLSLKEQAIEFIKTIPDDKFIYVMDMFNGIKGLLDENTQEEKQCQKMLLEEIKELRGIVHSSIDEKIELEKARDEKYESFN